MQGGDGDLVAALMGGGQGGKCVCERERNIECVCVRVCVCA